MSAKVRNLGRWVKAECLTTGLFLCSPYSENIQVTTIREDLLILWGHITMILTKSSPLNSCSFYLFIYFNASFTNSLSRGLSKPQIEVKSVDSIPSKPMFQSKCWKTHPVSSQSVWKNARQVVGCDTEDLEGKEFH